MQRVIAVYVISFCFWAFESTGISSVSIPCVHDAPSWCRVLDCYSAMPLLLMDSSFPARRWIVALAHPSSLTMPSISSCTSVSHCTTARISMLLIYHWCFLSISAVAVGIMLNNQRLIRFQDSNLSTSKCICRVPTFNKIFSHYRHELCVFCNSFQVKLIRKV